jgi:hypothetical protein
MMRHRAMSCIVIRHEYLRGGGMDSMVREEWLTVLDLPKPLDVPEETVRR